MKNHYPQPNEFWEEDWNSGDTEAHSDGRWFSFLLAPAGDLYLSGYLVVLASSFAV